MQTPIHNKSDDDASKGAGQDKHVQKLMFQSRFVMVFGQIDHRQAQRVCERLLAMSEESDKPIRVLVSSPGGHVESGDVIHDMIRFVRAPVITIGSGWVASAGTHIYLAAEKENRLCLPNTRFMIHQPSGGAGGPASDIEIQAKEILRTRERIARVISERTGQPFDKVLVDVERDFWMNPQQAIEYGMVSRVIQRYSDLDAA